MQKINLKSITQKPTLLLIAAAVTATACQPIKTDNTVHFTQDKPLEVNLNINANLNVVVTDARQDLVQITGQQPLNNVSPTDIGLDPDATTQPTTSTSTAPTSGAAIAPESAPVYLMDIGPRHARPLAQEDDLKAAMKARHPEVRALLDTHNAGEAHTGLLEPKGDLTPDQQTLLTAENNDRSALYKIEADKHGETIDKIAIRYYLARLNYARKGDWYEKFDKASKSWQWDQWNK